MLKKTFYFAHDYDPTGDPKMQALIGEYGAVGYGIFWRIIEMLHSDSDHRLPLKQYIFIAIAKQMLTSAEQTKEIIRYCIDVCELFVENDGYFSSDRVDRNLEKRAEISEKRSEAGRMGANAKQTIANAKQNVANVSKVKESKVKEIKRNNVITVNQELLKNTLPEETPYFFTFSNFDDSYGLQMALQAMFKHFIPNSEPTKAERTRLFNIVTKRGLPKNRCYAIVLEILKEYKNFPEEKKNFPYLFSRMEGKINDAIIIYREELAKSDKNKEKVETEMMMNESGTDPPEKEMNIRDILKNIVKSTSITK